MRELNVMYLRGYFSLHSVHACLIIMHSFNLQISMSVNWRHIHAVQMQIVLTLMAVLTARVMKALKGMGSTVQVQYALYTSIIM